MKILENWQYSVRMTFGQDELRLSGTLDGEFHYCSTPVKLDEKSLIVTTFSGNSYKLGACAGVLADQLKLIEEDIRYMRQVKQR